MSKFRIIKWRLFSEEKPLVPGEYLVFINGAEIPTLLTYECDDNSYGWRDDEFNYYSVKYWSYIPSHPDVPQQPIVKSENAKYALYLTKGEIIGFRECLAFAISYCDLPGVVQAALTPLLVYLENIQGDKK